MKNVLAATDLYLHRFNGIMEGYSSVYSKIQYERYSRSITVVKISVADTIEFGRPVSMHLVWCSSADGKEIKASYRRTHWLLCPQVFRLWKGFLAEK